MKTYLINFYYDKDCKIFFHSAIIKAKNKMQAILEGEVIYRSYIGKVIEMTNNLKRVGQ